MAPAAPTKAGESRIIKPADGVFRLACNVQLATGAMSGAAARARCCQHCHGMGGLEQASAVLDTAKV